MLFATRVAVLFSALFVASTWSWVQRQSMLFARSDFVAVPTGNQMFVLGGCNGNQSVTSNTCPSITDYFTTYSFSGDAWSQVAGGKAPRERYRYMAAAVGDSIYYVGGRYLNDTVILPVDVFNTKTQTWSTLPDQQGITAISDGASFSIGTKLYITGGYTSDYTPLQSTIVLDTSVTPLQFVKGTVANRTVGSGDNGAVTIGGYGYVFGGFSTDFCKPLTSLEKYDPVSNTWTALASFPQGRGDMAYAVVKDHLFIMGGETKDATCALSVPVADVQMYSPDKNTWKSVSPIAISRFRFSGGGWEAGTSIFDIGGQATNSKDGYYVVLNDVYSLDVSSYINSCTKTTPLVPLTILLTILFFVFNF